MVIGFFCCDDDKCSTNGCNSPKITNSTHDFSCFFSTNTVVCANIFCAGIPNDNKITKNAFQGGHCKKDTNFLSTLENYISTASLDGLDYGYTNLTCSSNDTCGSLEHCSWDNGGWSCYAWYANCDAQIVAPWPSSDSNNPLKTTTSLINSPTASPNLTHPPNDPNLPKIIIPVGVGTGVAVVVAGGATYCLIRRKKKRTQQLRNQSQEAMINQTEPRVNNEVIELNDLASKQEVTNELEKLIKRAKSKIGIGLELVLETLLDTQTEITIGNNTFAIRQSQREAKEKLQSKLSLAEIETLCQLKSELVQREQLVAQIEVGSDNLVFNTNSSQG